MNLATYLDHAGLTQETFAKKVGVRQSYISRLSRKSTKPGLQLALKIERETEGAVPATSWADEAEGATQ